MTRPLWCFTLLFTAALAATVTRAQAPQGRGGRGNIDLPEGSGKAEVQAYCTRCHQLGNIAMSGGYTRDGWRELIGTMVVLPKDQGDVIVDYLARNFPEQPKPKPVLVPGPVTVSFKEWNLPTLGSRPHDPLATIDGAIWYTGMFANVLGRVDPRTGQIKEYPLETPQSGPHGLTEDKDGRIWFTANSKGYIGEPDLRAYAAAASADKVRVEHIMKPGETGEDNPHHFVLVRVDGERLSLEVISTRDAPYLPYPGGRSKIALSDSGS